MSSIVVVGASAGLGAALAIAVPEPGDRVWTFSRTRPTYLDRSDGVARLWHACDLSQPDAPLVVRAALAGQAIDLLLYTAGIWESSANLEQTQLAEFQEIMAVNVTAFIGVCQALADNLRAAGAAKIVAIGSTAGLENATGPRAVYSASKFGLRGAVHGLREHFRAFGIAVTCISPGGLASDVPVDEGVQAALHKHDSRRIPSADIVEIVKTIVRLSPATCVKEIDLPAMKDVDA